MEVWPGKAIGRQLADSEGWLDQTAFGTSELPIWPAAVDRQARYGDVAEFIVRPYAAGFAQPP